MGRIRRAQTVEKLVTVALRAGSIGARDRLGMQLATRLERLPPLPRAECVADWASHDDWRVRAVVARALRDPVPVLGAPSAIEVLARDPYGEVRMAACEAAACRITESPSRMAAVLGKLSEDTHRQIRLGAIEGLQKALQIGVREPGVINRLARAADSDDPEVAAAAVDAMAQAPSWALNRVWEAYEELAAHPEDHDAEVIEHLVIDLGRLAAFEPGRAQMLLSAVERGRQSS